MRKIPLNIIALSNTDSQPNSFVVILKEENGNRRLPVVIGGFEAQAIAIAIEQIKPNRPLTHDLFKNALIELGVKLKEIIISELKDGIFYATLVCTKPDGQSVKMDSRTSDALALAVRFECPIYVKAEILDEAGIQLESPGPSPEEGISPGPSLPKMSVEDLEKLLTEALENENYERAAEIRDELKKRENK